jgi:hypothetical protein
MRKYIQKKLSDYPIIEGYSQIESVIFQENNYSDPYKIFKDFPDLYKRSWLSKFLNTEITGIGNQEKFVEYISNNKDKHYCIIGDYDKRN